MAQEKHPSLSRVRRSCSTSHPFTVDRGPPGRREIPFATRHVLIYLALGASLVILVVQCWKQFDDYEDLKDQRCPWVLPARQTVRVGPQRCLLVRGTATEVSQLRAVWSLVSVILFECSMHVDSKWF